MFSNNIFMEEAICEAELALQNGEFPIGAVIVCDSKIIARAHNRVESRSNPILHAEICAINDAVSFLQEKYLTRCDIYITLEPCLMCFKAISLVKMRSIYYALSNSSKYSIEKFDPEVLDLNHTPQIYGGIGESKVSALFSKHLAKIRE